MVTKTQVIETINHSIWFETSLSFHCDFDSLRLGNSIAIETEILRDGEVLRLLRLRLIEIGLTCRD